MRPRAVSAIEEGMDMDSDGPEWYCSQWRERTIYRGVDVVEWRHDIACMQGVCEDGNWA